MGAESSRGHGNQRGYGWVLSLAGDDLCVHIVRSYVLPPVCPHAGRGEEDD